MKSILLIGLGRFGRNTAKKLSETGVDVLAVDKNEDNVNKTLEYVSLAQIGDSTNSDFLKSLGIRNFDVCIVAIGDDFQSSLETTSLLKELGANHVVSRASSERQAKLLLKIGADEIVYPEKQLADWTAIRYGSNNIFNYIELTPEYSIYETAIPAEWLGKSILELDARKKYTVNILATKENGKINPIVLPSTVLTRDMTLLVLGAYKNVKKCFKI